jgi:hypothetical protein
MEQTLESAINIYNFLKHELRCESKILSDLTRLSEDASSQEEAITLRAHREVIYAKQSLLVEEILNAAINVRRFITPENKEEVRRKYGFM